MPFPVTLTDFPPFYSGFVHLFDIVKFLIFPYKLTVTLPNFDV